MEHGAQPSNILATRVVDRELDRIQAHKGPIGDPQGARGTLPNFPQIGKSRENLFFKKGFWGKLAFPNTFWVPYNPFWSREIP